MQEIVTVKFEFNKTSEEFLASDLKLRLGDRCVVATERGVELGIIVQERQIPEQQLHGLKLLKALRRATERDLYLYEKKKDREEYAQAFCKKRLKVRKLPMKLSGVECIFDGSRVIFYFTAEGRVDFRELVKDLARELRTRIEMRQIGTRDEAKLIGGQGLCGRGENCSSSFLKNLRSVSVRAAKQQELDLNPSRLSGMCGRLKCCLNFELNGSCGGSCEEEGCLNLTN